jgi:serine/threonine protein kinase
MSASSQATRPDDSSAVSKRFDSISLIAAGGFGEVYKARDRVTHAFVALKQILWGTLGDNGFPETTIREIKLARELRHPNISSLREVFFDPQQRNVYLVLEYCEFDLAKLIQSVALSVAQVKSYMRQILTAVYICHCHRVYHRDLKPMNILVTAGNRIQLADFGLAQKIPPKERRGGQTFRVITIFYRPLELLLQGRHYGEEVDVWSLGCIFYEMITGRELFRPALTDENDIQNETLQAMEIVKICGPPEAVWPEVAKLPEYKMIRGSKEKGPGLDDFLTRTLPRPFLEAKPLLLKMLRIRPSERCNVRDALDDPFLLNVDGSLDPERLPKITIAEAHSKVRPVKPNARVEAAAKQAGVAPPRPKPV